MKEIELSRRNISGALSKLKRPLEQYQSLQHFIRSERNFAHNREFRRQFNNFYRVRRNPEWQDHYYALMARLNGRKIEFEEILLAIQKSTGRVEASFASKLLASLKPTNPVIDSLVFKQLGISLPYRNSEERLDRIVELYRHLRTHYRNYLATPDGQRVVYEFQSRYPSARITRVKMLDFVLWQQRT